MLYALEYSYDKYNWKAVGENKPVTRDRLQDVQREAEFYSRRYPYVRIVHPGA